jgi:hypothetical protein
MRSEYPSQVTLNSFEDGSELTKPGTTPYARNGVGINPLKDDSPN